MPFLVADNRRYRVSLGSFFKGKAYKESLAWNRDRSGMVNLGYHANFFVKTVLRPAEYDQLLRPPNFYKTSRHISSIMVDPQPTHQLNRLSDNTHFGKSKRHAVGELMEEFDDHYTDENTGSPGVAQLNTKQGGSLSEKWVTGLERDDDEDSGFYRTGPEKVLYVDDIFSREDVLLLHQIALQWERERWVAVSTRYSRITGRNVTPEQARSAIDS